jgi:Holliday junction resolvasome RuvABC endonuclease subunit
MTEFEENNPEQLKQFLKELNKLVDKFHPNLYLINKVFKGVTDIEIAVLDELNRDK